MEESTSEWTAIVRTPSRRAVRMIRRAISPRLAISRLSIIAAGSEVDTKKESSLF